MIKKIELVNFMSHDRTVIEPAEGLTVLVGPNNCGKSAIVNALKILCYNEKSTYVTRHHEKSCSVSVTTAEGDVVEWRRNNDSPKYIINGELFDRLGGNVPDELHKVLRLPRVASEGGDPFDVHFGEQKSPVFLLDEPGTRAAQFFAASSDAAKLVEMQRRHKQSVGEARKESALLQSRSEALKVELSTLDVTYSLQTVVETLEEQHSALGRDEAARQALAELIPALVGASSSLAHLHAVAGACEALIQPPTLIDLVPIDAVITALTVSMATNAVHAARADALSSLIAPPSLETEQDLTDTIGALEQATGAEASLTELCDAIAPLADPPVLYATAPLMAVTAELAELRTRAQVLERAASVLGLLSPLPTLTDTRDLECAIHDLTTAAAALTADTREQAEADRELNRCETLIRQDLGGSICPTCGASVDAERLMGRSANCHGGRRDA